MDKLVEKIVDIEKKAKNADASIKQEVDQMYDVAKQECEKTRNEIIQKAKERISELNEIESKDTLLKIEDIKMDYAEKREKIVKVFSENKDKWTNKVFENIISSK